MRLLKRDNNTPLFVPDFQATSLLKVDFKLLKSKGIKYIAFDADSTLVPFRGKLIDDTTRQFLSEQRDYFTAWCVASNRVTNDLDPLARSIDATVVRASLRTRKPQKRYFAGVLKHLQAKPSEVAMVGDKLIADMWGAKRMGFTTVWVEKIGKDSIWDRAFGVRKWEARLMRKFVVNDEQ